MKGWRTATFGEVLQKTESVDPLKSPNDEFDYVDVSSVSNLSHTIEETQRLLGKDAPSRARRLIRTNDVLFATIRPTLSRIAIVPEELDGEVCSTGYFVLRPKEALDHRFVFYFLQADQFMGRIAALQKGASYPAVTDADVRSQLISFPPLPEQHRIVAILDEAFAGIAVAKANAEQNRRNARELLASKSAQLLQPQDDWTVATLADLLERGWITSHLDGNHGSDYPRKEEFVGSGIPYIAASAIRNGNVDFDEAKYLTKERAASIRKGVAKDGDVLFAHNATVGPVAILRTKETVILGTSLTYYRCNRERVLPEYLARFMASPLFVTQYEQVMKQSTRNQVPITKQREFLHFIPPIDAQQAISASLDELEPEKRSLESLYTRKLAALDELKQSLLHAAFSGAL